VPCPHCAGAGVVRSTASVALHVLRVLEDNLLRSAQYDLTVRCRAAVALYILNHKRAHLRDLEARFGVAIIVEADDSLAGGVNHTLERGEPARGVRAIETEGAGRPGYGAIPDEDFPLDETPEPEEEEEAEEVAEAGEEDEERAEGAESAEDASRRRRRRRRRRGERGPGEAIAADAPQPADDGLHFVAEIGGDFTPPADGPPEEARSNGSRRRRSRRGRRDRFGPRVGETGAGAEGTGEFEIEAETSLDAGEGEFAPASQPSEGEYAAVSETSDGLTTFGEAPASIAEALEPPAPAETAPHAEAAPEAEPPQAAEPPKPVLVEPEIEVDDTPRPRRSGWWQRAKSTLVGE
jgi:ribonuclease E